MNNLTSNNENFDNYFFNLVRQILARKFLLIFFILIGFFFGVYQTFFDIEKHYESEFIIKKNPKIDTLLSKNINELIDTNNQLDVLNKIVSTQRFVEKKGDGLQNLSSFKEIEEYEATLMKNLVMLGSLLKLDLASNTTKSFLESQGQEFVKDYLTKNFFNGLDTAAVELEAFKEITKTGFVSIINKNNLTTPNLDIQSDKLFLQLINLFKSQILIHNLTKAAHTYEFKIIGTDAEKKLSTNSFALVKINSKNLIKHKEIIKKDLNHLNHEILSKIKADIKIETTTRIQDFQNIIEKANSFMSFYRSIYASDKSTEVNLATQEYYLNEIKELAKVEKVNMEKFENILNDILIYELVTTIDHVTYNDSQLQDLLIPPLIMFIIFILIIFLTNYYRSYSVFVKQNK